MVVTEAMSRSNEGDNISFPFVGPGHVLASGIALPLVGIVLVGLRVLVRWSQSSKSQRCSHGADDWLLYISLVWLIALGIVFVYGENQKIFGYPMPPSPPIPEDELPWWLPAELEHQGKFEAAFQIIMPLEYGFVKLSILVFFRRIFLVSKKTTFDYATLAIGTVVAAWMIAMFVAFITVCGSDVAALWAVSPAEHVRRCPGSYPLEVVMASSDLVLDIVVLALPFPLIWKLHLSISRKIQVSAVFLVGLMTIASSIARLIIYIQIFTIAVDPRPISEDIMLVVTLGLYWSMLEAGLAFMAASLPPLSPLLQYIPWKFRINLSSLRSSLSGEFIRSRLWPGDHSQSHLNSAEAGENTRTVAPSPLVQRPGRIAIKEDQLKIIADFLRDNSPPSSVYTNQ